MGTPMKPEKMAKKIVKIHKRKHPRAVYKIHQNIGLVLLSLLPKKTQCAVIKLLLSRK